MRAHLPEALWAFALAVIVATGLSLALAARGGVKRAVGLLLCHFGAALALLRAPGGGAAAVSALVMGLAFLALGLALAVRLREAYRDGGVALADAMDDAEDRAERDA